MKGKTLVGAVTDILHRRVTEAEAMQYALNNFGELSSYIRAKQIESLALSRSKSVTNKVFGTTKLN